MTKDERYCNAKVYKLIDTINGYYYIGSTCMQLSKRLSYHKKNAKIETERKVYKCFNMIGWENVKIILHSEHYLENKEQLLREEDNVIQMFLHDVKCLNSMRSFNSEDYKKEYHKEYAKEYRGKNKEKIKEHNENNKEKIKEYHKEYYEKNKEKMKTEIKCVCGSTIQKIEIKRHEKTKKHINYINDLANSAETI